ncbi:MAG: DUF4197 family protein, partial [Gammaproteobacteria bacterium]
MKMSHIKGFSLIVLLAASGHASADFGDWLNILKGSVTTDSKQSGESTAADLSNSDMIGALKQALDKGVTHAVSQLGQTGGFLNDKRVRIPMPEKLAWVEKSLRAVGQDKLADEFITSI